MTHPSPASLDKLIDHPEALRSSIARGSFLFVPGDQCKHFVYVCSGTVRVEGLSISGDQMLLYRIHKGETCVMTTSCLLGNNRYSAQAVAESDIEIVLLPRIVFQHLLDESVPFRQAVFDGFSQRLGDMIARITDLATRTIDERLSTVLVAQTRELNAEKTIDTTHEQLATEIGSAREVVSRRLAAFEKQGLLSRQRGKIKILDYERLTKLIDRQGKTR